MIEEKILLEISLRSFRDKYLDRSPVFLKGSSILHKDLALAEVDSYLTACEGILHQFVRVVKDHSDEIVHSNPTFFPETQKAFINRKYQEGATIKVEQFDTRHPVVAALCRSLEAEFGGATYAMTFLTPPSSTAFRVHFDPAPAFIVQLEGSKQWTVYDRFVESPTQVMNYSIAGEKLSAPLIEVTLEQGDVLYIPSGFPHVASCSTSHSLHMTIGMETWRPYDLIKFALTALIEKNPELRRHVYAGSENTLEQVTEAISVFCKELAGMKVEKLFDAFETAFNANQPDANVRGLSNYSKSLQITETSRVRRVSGKSVKIYDTGEEIVLYPSSTIRPGRPLLTAPPHIKLPSFTKIEVAHILERHGDTEICALPGDLDAESKVILVGELIKYGVAEVL